MKKGFTKSFILVIALVLIHQLMQHETRACNVAVITSSASATGRPFIWKNRDHANSYRHEVKFYPEVIPGVGGSLRLMGETTWDSNVAVCTGGSNESGFAIANTTCVDSDNDPLDLNNVNTDLMEDALEECKTLSEFEEMLGEFTTRYSNKNISGIFAVIDAYNGAAIYEMWTDGNGNDIMYRKFNVNTGAVTDENGAPFSDYSVPPTVGFANRTNSNHTNGWIQIDSDDPRELRARQLFTEMMANDELTPRNLMREVSKDVCGDDPADYCLTDWVRDKWDYTIDSYDNPNRDGQMYTRFCISRYQTSMGLVIEGAATPEEADLTTMWVALGEPSLSVFVPYFPAAQNVSKYATDDAHTNSGYYWDGSSSTSDNKDNSFLNLLYDCVQSNPFGSSHELYSIYSNLELYKNNGSGAFFWDTQDRNDGGTYLVIYTKMDTTINYPRLENLQTWTLPLEDNVFDRTEEFISILEDNPSLITSEELADFSNYCNRYVYQNYSNQSDSYVLWDRPLPDNGVAPTVGSVNTGSGTNFPVNGVISVTFSEPMNEDSIDENTFGLFIGSTRVNGSVSYDSATMTATFDPGSNLQYNTTYTVVLTDDIQDLSGRAMDGNYSWTFTTVKNDTPPVDDVHPTVSSVTPADETENYPIAGVVSAKFSEAMDAGTINEDSFEVFDGTDKVSGSVSYNTSNFTATFEPDTEFAASTEFTVELSTGITDLADNGVIGGYTWNFTTSDGIDDPPINPPVTKKSSSGSSDGCGSAAEASTLAGGTRPFMPGLMSLMVTMLFPLSLMMLHRRARRRNRG